MVTGKMQLVFADIMQELRASGYKVFAWKLNAMYFHVPQSRERIIVIGARNDLGISPSPPKAQRRPFTVRDALYGITPTPLELANCCRYLEEGTFYHSVLKQLRQGEYGDAITGGKLFNASRLAWSRPGKTIPKKLLIFHPEENRLLATPELKRIGAFPDQYYIAGSYPERWAQIGNSVPPLMMRAIASHVQQSILRAGNVEGVTP